MADFPTLYTRDASGTVRFWRMELNPERPDQYRTVAGVLGGAEVPSGWTTATPKNVGRSNETSSVEQAVLEVEAQYQKKRDRKYHDDPDNVGGYKFFAPMLAQKYEPLKSLSGLAGPVYVQPKLDGIRAVICAEGATTRQGKPIMTVPHVLRDLEPVFSEYPDLVLDGELYNHDLRDDFNEVSSVVRRPKPSPADLAKAEKLVQYHIYDVAAGFDGGFGARIGSLHTLVGYAMGFSDPLEAPASIRLVETYAAETGERMDELYAHFLAEGYEGQMVRLDAPYEEGKRSKHLLKRKEFQDAEFDLVRVEEGEGNWAGYAKTAVIRLPDGREQSSGMRGSMAMQADRLRTWTKFRKVTVRYQNLTPDGFLRFPVIVDWHEGERAD